MDDDITSISGHNIEYQQREWTVQRFGWVAMGLFVLAAFVGLLGSGPLTTAQSEAADGSLHIEYSRIERHHQPRVLTVTVMPESVQDDEIRLWIDRSYLRNFRVQRIVPEPESVEIEPGRAVYVFTAGATDDPLTITFHYECDGYWQQHGRLGLVDSASVEFTQFAFP